MGKPRAVGLVGKKIEVDTGWHMARGRVQGHRTTRQRRKQCGTHASEAISMGMKACLCDELECRSPGLPPDSFELSRAQASPYVRELAACRANRRSGVAKFTTQWFCRFDPTAGTSSTG